MDYEDMIEDEDQPAEGTPESEEEPVAAEDPPAKSPWKAFILTGFIAALIGAAGGGYGAYAGLKTLTPPAVTQPKVDLAPLESRLKKLTDRVSAAEASALEAANNPSVEFEPVDMSGLEDRLTALETAPSPEIDAGALKALQAAQDDGFAWPDTSAIEDRIAALESVEDAAPKSAERLTALEAEVETLQTAGPASAADSPVFTELENRLTALEDLPASASVPAVSAKRLTALTARLKALEDRPAPAPKIERVSILAFPKERLIEAAENNVQGGLIKKTISHHIRVKGANDPLTLIEGIETDISEGNLQAAVEKFERLPSPVRSAGQAWYESVKASL